MSGIKLLRILMTSNIKVTGKYELNYLLYNSFRADDVAVLAASHSLGNIS